MQTRGAGGGHPHVLGVTRVTLSRLLSVRSWKVVSGAGGLVGGAQGERTKTRERPLVSAMVCHVGLLVC